MCAIWRASVLADTGLASALLGVNAEFLLKDRKILGQLRETTAERFAGGVVVYDGEQVAGFGDKLYAVPIRALWETV